MKLIKKNRIRNFLLQFATVLLCLFLSINSFCQNVATKTPIDTNIINSLEAKTKSIHYGNPELGIKLIDSLCAYYKQYGRQNEYYIAQLNLGHCYNVQQKNYQALRIYDECFKYFIKQNDSLHLFHVYTGIGNVNFGLRNKEKAAYHLLAATQICDEKKYPHHKFLAYQNYANCFAETKQFDSVFVYYKKSEELLKYIKRPSSAYRLKLNYAYIYCKTNQYSLAIKTLPEVLAYYKTSNDVHALMRVYEILGQSYLGLKDVTKARLYIDTTVILNKKYKSASDNYDILEDYYKIDSTAGDIKQANARLLQMLALKDSFYEENRSNLINDLLVKYETEKKEVENRILEKENKERVETIRLQRILIGITGLLSIVIIAILFFYLRFRNRQQKKMAEKEQIAAELKALKAQLNPHFIQNIFQIIANQVSINPVEVSAFLQKTSNYFRSVLNGTDKSVQSLEDEILFTENYLQFQQSLFQNKLTYSIELADDIDSFGIMVPTMLLQPFIENSIKYGLQQSQQPMHIQIYFHIDEAYLKICIIDNGNSESNADNINNKSFGNALISKRLNLFYKNAKHQPKLSSTALNDNKGFAVNIYLPV